MDEIRRRIALIFYYLRSSLCVENVRRHIFWCFMDHWFVFTTFAAYTDFIVC